MGTIKSYTDLEQSRKLAEILPLDSADICWFEGEPFVEAVTGYQEERAKFHRQAGMEMYPCWSLAALLSVMPQINDWITPHKHKNDRLSQFEPKVCKIWEHSIIPSYKVTYGNGLSTDIYDNPVDACYDMIIKLNELKML